MEDPTGVVKAEAGASASASASTSGGVMITSNSSVVARLPDKIMEILLKEDAPEAIWWLDGGKAFAIQKEKFQKQVLDTSFRGNKFKSLVRNLHRWYEYTQDLRSWCMVYVVCLLPLLFRLTQYKHSDTHTLSFLPTNFSGDLNE